MWVVEEETNEVRCERRTNVHKNKLMIFVPTLSFYQIAASADAE